MTDTKIDPSPSPSPSPAMVSEHSTELRDGCKIFYRAWLPDTPTDKVLLLFHRGHEHSGRLIDVVEGLALEDVAVFAWDSRGHGRSEGERGYAPSFGCMVQDVDTFVRHVSKQHGFAIENMVVMAHSVGAVAVATWVHDYAPRIRALVLATPAFHVKLYVPFAVSGLRFWQWLRSGRKSFVKSYVKSRMLTHDPEQARRYDEDELTAKAIAVNILLEMHDTARRIVADAAAIRVPTLVLSGGSDWVVRVTTQRSFFENLGSPHKKLKFYPGMYHDILHEQDRHLVLEDIRGYVRAAFEEPHPRPPLLDAHEKGYTKAEHDRLSQPLGALTPRWWFWKGQSWFLRTVGRLSRGVRLGWDTGFDSGKTLDYVYDNKPTGALLIGEWIDYCYLNSPGWRGIRQRKVNLQNLITMAIQDIVAAGYPVRLLDVATGAGRYVLDTIQALVESLPETNPDVTAVLRDFTPANLEVGRGLAASMGLRNVTFEQGDAFDEESVANVEPAPNIGIVSGLYELFPDNDKVRASLRGLRRALERGAAEGGGVAYLVYTGQPWHPQLEMIARVLTNREGKPWIMRRRTQEEMDDLVRDAGFQKLRMEIDNDGIFTVSLARLELEAT